MTEIANLVQVRADGKVLPTSMTVNQILALGLPPCKTTALRWINAAKLIEVSAPHGVHGIVVTGDRFVAAIFAEDEQGASTRLAILSPDGFELGTLANEVEVSGRRFSGHYDWFEPAMVDMPSTFGVVFQTETKGALRCDIDASDRRVSRVIRIR